MIKNQDKIINKIIFLSQVLLLIATVEADERGDLILKRTKDLGKTFTTIHEDIYSFGYIGAFLFFSVMEDSVRRLNIFKQSSQMKLTNATLIHCNDFAPRDPLGSCISHRTKEKPSVERCFPLPPLSR